MTRPLFAALLLAAGFLLAPAAAQTAIDESAPRNARRVVVRVMPEYPALLKSSGMSGVVKLRITVLANGTVGQASTLGGNPVFAESSIKAVLQWKFAPAAAPSSEVISLHFTLH